jgi:hypothetical protein
MEPQVKIENIEPQVKIENIEPQVKIENIEPQVKIENIEPQVKIENTIDIVLEHPKLPDSVMEAISTINNKETKNNEKEPEPIEIKQNIVGLIRVHYSNISQIMLSVETIKKQKFQVPIYFTISHAKADLSTCQLLQKKISANKNMVCLLHESETIPSPMLLFKNMFEQADKAFPNAWYFFSHGCDLWHPSRTGVYAKCTTNIVNNAVVIPVHVQKIPGCKDLITDVEKALEEQKAHIAIPDAMGSIEHYMVYRDLLYTWFIEAKNFINHKFSDWIFQRYFCLGSTRITSIDLTVGDSIPLWMFYRFSERVKIDLPSAIWDHKETQKVLKLQLQHNLIIPPKRVLTEIYNRLITLACFSTELDESKTKQICRDAAPGDLYSVYKKVIELMAHQLEITNILTAPVREENQPFPNESKQSEQ